MSAVATIVETPPDALALATRELEPAEALVLRADIADFLGRVTVLRERAKGICVTARGQESEERAARVTRLALRTLRVEGIKRCKDLKASSLRRGRALDGVAAVIREMIEPIEEALELHEKFTERADAADRGQLQSARAEALHALGADPATFADLGVMSAESWTATLDGARLAHEARIEVAKHEAAVKAEAERIASEKRAEEQKSRIKAEAERVELARVQAEENARLKAEAAEREAASARELAAVRAEADAEAARVKTVHEAERAAAEREARRKHEEDTAARKVAHEAEEARQAELRKAQEENERAARELAAVKAAAAKEAQERAEAEKARVAAEASARTPTKLKYSLLARALEGIAQWGEPIESCDEPCAAAKARAVLELVGLAPKADAS